MRAILVSMFFAVFAIQAPCDTYTVQNAGQNLGQIAQEAGTTIKELTELNNIPEDVYLSAGTVLQTPDKQESAASASPSSATETAIAATTTVSAPAPTPAEILTATAVRKIAEEKTEEIITKINEAKNKVSWSLFFVAVCLLLFLFIIFLVLNKNLRGIIKKLDYEPPAEHNEDSPPDGSDGGDNTG